MSGPKFTDVNLAQAEFDDVNLCRARFHNINMSDISVSAAQMGGAKFKHIGLPPGSKEKQRPIAFEEADLNGIVLSKCNLSNEKNQELRPRGNDIGGILVTALLAAYGSKRRP